MAVRQSRSRPPSLRNGSRLLIEGTCTHGGGLLRKPCGLAASGQCVYCGEPFCERHGDRGADYHEVCQRKACQAKFADVRDHKAWIVDHAYANATGMCAVDECGTRMEHGCERCRLRFCGEHLRLKSVVEERGLRKQKRSLLLCPHCRERRKIWD